MKCTHKLCQCLQAHEFVRKSDLASARGETAESIQLLRDALTARHAPVTCRLPDIGRVSPTIPGKRSFTLH